MRVLALRRRIETPILLWRRGAFLLRCRSILRRRVEPPVLLWWSGTFLLRRRSILRRRVETPVLLRWRLPVLRRAIAAWLFLPEVRAPLV